MLKGFSIPRTPEGKSSLVPTPPWHYVSDQIIIEYQADPKLVNKFLPDCVDDGDGRCAVCFCDWQTSTDSAYTYLDPLRSQYREAFFTVGCNYKGRYMGFVPYIWVDNDVAMMRGYIQGWPKQLGSVWMTRTFNVPSNAAPMVDVGGKFGASCAAKDNRIIDGQITLKEKTTTGPKPGSSGFLNNMLLPDLREGKQDEVLLNNMTTGSISTDLHFSEMWKGDAMLKVHDDYYVELKAFQPLEVYAGYYFSMAHSLQAQTMDEIK